ncbi:hypothetical protein ASC66_16920 [Leifsonia sp. Root4]|uniref:ASCH domain-containing protein n=1 Tax=Leifsonia sp. Root4 TaxID=1736525 RepID=UPI0006FF936C|nr:ASCH domain-containing protein [Leifsonia sp. Root4]KQW03728.1 hypothetical protein ASC66_16920 [Leifsonia sp. Root4]
MTFPTVDGLRTMELGSPGGLRAHLNDCVLNGTKRATAGLLSEYITENEPWEHVGERLVLVDDDEAPLGVIEVTAVLPTTFAEVTWEFAQAEGEGFVDLEDWRRAHRDYWATEGEHVTAATPVLCIYFELVARSYSARDYQSEGL